MLILVNFSSNSDEVLKNPPYSHHVRKRLPLGSAASPQREGRYPS